MHVLQQWRRCCSIVRRCTLYTAPGRASTSSHACRQQMSYMMHVNLAGTACTGKVGITQARRKRRSEGEGEKRRREDFLSKMWGQAVTCKIEQSKTEQAA